MKAIRYPETTAIVALTAVGFLLRIYALGDLGFRWDEDLTSIAVKAVLEHGYPLLDSGMIYHRFLTLQYLLAGWTSVFGFSEYTVRFPIAVFGTALIPLTFVIARDLAGARAAWIAAILMAFDFWEVELARTARMYAPFFVVYALFAIAVYRGLVFNERVWRILLLPIGFLAITVHDVGLFCAGLVLLPVVFFSDRRQQPFPYIAAAVLLGFFWQWRKFSLSLWHQYERTAADVLVDGGIVLASVSEALGNLVARLDERLHLPEFSLLGGLFSTVEGVAVWVLFLAGSIFLCLYWTRSANRLSQALAVMTVFLAFMQQFTLVLLAWVLFAGCERQGAKGLKSRRSLLLALLVGVALAFWIVSLWFMGFTGDDAKYVIKSLFEFPRFRMVMAYPQNRPLMFLAALAGAGVIFDRIARPDPDRRSIMLAGLFAVSYLTVGLFDSTYSHFRYVLHADVFFMALAGLGISQLARAVESWRRSRKDDSPMSRGATVPYIVTSALLILLTVNPVRAVFAVSRDYVVDEPIARLMNLGSWPDFKTTSEFISRNLRPTDRILVLNPREFYNYLGRIDGWIRSTDYYVQTVERSGRPHDKYIDVPLILTVEELKAAIADAPGRTWLPFSRNIFGYEKFGGVEPQIAEFLKDSASREVMVGRDGSMVVYLFDPGDESPPVENAQ